MAFDLLSKRSTCRNWSAHTILGSDDPMVWTPSAVKAEMLRVLGIVDLVNLDVSKAFADKKISDAEWRQWRQEYLGAHQFLTSSSSLWGSNVAIARQREQDALKWRELIASRGGNLQGPKNPGRKEDGITTTQVALAVGGIAATALLITAIRK